VDNWPAGRAAREPNSHAFLKLPNSRKSAIYWPGPGLSWNAPGAPGVLWYKRVGFLPKNFEARVDIRFQDAYIIEETIEREGNVPFLLLLIPLKLLLIVLVLQQLLP
jgi:hypothetical protein